METGLRKLKNLAYSKLRNEFPSVPTHAVPMPKYTDITSNQLTKCVVHWIELNGFQAERINSTGRQLDTRKISTDILGNTRTIGSVKWIKGSSQVGTADVSSVIKGRAVKIEIKCKATGDNYQSQGQKDYQNKIEQAGGVYIIVRTFEDFYNWYNDFIK